MCKVWNLALQVLFLFLPTSCSNPPILPRTWDPAFSDPITLSPRIVILVTAFRSGSTFIGELFNQNPNILYEFEPLHSEVMRERRGLGYYRGESARHLDDEVNQLIIQQMISNCTFVANPFINIMNKYYKCPPTVEQIEELYGEGVTTCSEGGGMGPGIGAIRRYLCRRRDAVVLKVIRLRRIRDLELIKNIRSADIRVIQLMRDPRAMFRSRSGFKDIFQAKINHMDWTRVEMWQKLALEAHTECETYLNNLEYAESSPWLKDRYMTIKHDEMATRSAEIAEELYRFVGLPMHEDVEKYLKDVLNSEPDVVHAKSGDTGKGGTLNTYKDSKEVNVKWMKWRLHSIRNVDKHCARFIKKMGWPFLIDPDRKFYETLPEFTDS